MQLGGVQVEQWQMVRLQLVRHLPPHQLLLQHHDEECEILNVRRSIDSYILIAKCFIFNDDLCYSKSLPNQRSDL